jgi:hypothetical protein
VEIKPDAAGLAAISELARKANDETMTEIKKTQEEKMKVLITAPEIPMEELISLRAHIDECDDDFSNEPLTVDYTAKWDDLQPATTKTLLIEDIEDSKPHSSQEASQLMEDAILGELDLPEFKPITGKVLTIAPDKIVPVDEFESIMNDPEPPPMATPAPTTPRKKLMILDEDEI